MKAKTYLSVGFLVTVILCLSACSNGYRYLPQSLAPRAYYVEDQVYTIQTIDDIAANKPVYIELGTRDGKKESGSLLRITSREIVYFDKTKQKTTTPSAGNRGKARSIAKEDILFLKVW
jgi:hypothetical protein